MMKNLRFMLLSTLMLLTSTAFAQTDFDFDANGSTMFGLAGESSNDSHDGDFTEAKSATIGDFTVTVSAANEGVSNANRIWSTAPKLRMYSGTLTVASTGARLTKMVFTLATQASKAKWGADNSASTGTIDAEAKTTVTWTGDASEVVFTIAANTQISKITINGEGGGEVTPPTPDPDPEVKVVTVAEFNAAEVSNDVWYQLTGTVKNLNDGDLYGNFDLEDATGSVYVYGLLAEKGGAKKLFQELVAAQGIKNGSKLTIIGNRGVYKEKIEVMNAYFVSIDNSGIDTPPVSNVEKAANIAAFKAMAEGTVAELTLTNAQVLYVNVYNNTTELFVRDATGAADLYELGIQAEAEQVLNGTIIGKRGTRSGFTYAMLKADNTNASTVTVGAKQTVEPAAIASLDEATYDAYGCDLVKITNVKVSADGKKAMADGDELALYDRFKTNLLSGLEEDKEYDITGLIYDGGATYGTELVVTALTLAGGGEIVEDPATPVASIEALLALESPSANLELTLTNAKVLFNDGNYIYVRENGKGLCFYKVDAVKELFKNNAVVNGKIQVDYELYKLLPEVKANKNTNADNLTVVESEEAAEPVQTTLADVAAGKNVCDLVTLSATFIKEVEYKEDGETIKSTTYYLQDGDTKLVVVNNGKNLNKLAEAGVETVVVTGIVNTNNNGYQIKLTKNAEDPTGINDIIADGQADGRIFNLAGQRIEKVQRGINIIGGKKLMVK